METVDIVGLWTRYGSLLWENGKHKGCCKGYLSEMQSLIDKHQICQIDNRLVDALRIEWRAKGNKNSTINRKISCLGKLLRRYHQDGCIDRLPNLRKYPERNGRIRFLTPTEQNRLFSHLDAINPKYAELSRLMVETGCRYGEAVGLRWADVENGYVTFWETKNFTPRSIPLTRLARTVLARSRGHTNQPGPFTTVSYQNFRHAWVRARRAAGLGSDLQVVPHILRHTCASRLAQAGIDIKRIQEFLGHKSLSMTMRYAHLAPNNLVECVHALETFHNSEIDDGEFQL